MKNILVVYYTHSQNTAKLANLITQEVNADVAEIISQKAYPESYGEVIEQAKKEISRNFRPALKLNPDISKYDTIFVGTPNWWSSIAPPVATFLEAHDFANKTIVPFATHGGGGFGHIEKDVKNLVPNAKVLTGFASYGSSANKSEVQNWLKSINLA